MKSKISYHNVSGFAAGLILGIIVTAMVAFTNNPAGPASGTTPVSLTTANTYIKNYMNGATVYNQVMKGYAIDRSQLDAMNSILSENAALTGFRMYKAKDNNGQKIIVVVGVTSTGKDAVGNTMYTTQSVINDPCPPVCDMSSTIIQN